MSKMRFFVANDWANVIINTKTRKWWAFFFLRPCILSDLPQNCACRITTLVHQTRAGAAFTIKAPKTVLSADGHQIKTYHGLNMRGTNKPVLNNIFLMHETKRIDNVHVTES